MPPTGDMTCKPGMCLDWELNKWPFGSQASAQSTEPHQLGQEPMSFKSADRSLVHLQHHPATSLSQLHQGDKTLDSYKLLEGIQIYTYW